MTTHEQFEDLGYEGSHFNIPDISSPTNAVKRSRHVLDNTDLR
jgi:hypothetical protein